MLASGAIKSHSTKQKKNARNSTESELISIDEVLSKMLQLFFCRNKVIMQKNLLLHDNQTSMKVEMNGKTSSGKRIKFFNIKHFYNTDLIKR